MTSLNLIDYWWLFHLALFTAAITLYWLIVLVVDCTRTGMRWWLRERKWHRASPHYGSVYDGSISRPRPNIRRA